MDNLLYEELSPEEQKKFDKEIKQWFADQKQPIILYAENCHRDIETYFDPSSEHYMGKP